MEVLCWREGGCGVRGFDKFFFLFWNIYIFFLFFGKSPENEFSISHFSFLILRFAF